MLALISIDTIDSFIEANLSYVAMGHIGLVLLLVIILLAFGKGGSGDYDRRDEENFDYRTGDAITFKPVAGVTLPDMEPEESVTFTDDRPKREQKIVLPDEPGPTDTTKENNDTVEPDMEAEPSEETEETASETPSDIDQRKQDKVREILSVESDHAILAINRDEMILDLNSKAHELLQYEREDLEGKKIDEIIYLEAADSESESGSKQIAKGERKDGTLFPISVELEMADREFGIITVTLFLLSDPSAPIPASEEAEEENDELIGETVEETIIETAETSEEVIEEATPEIAEETEDVVEEPESGSEEESGAGEESDTDDELIGAVPAVEESEEEDLTLPDEEETPDPEPLEEESSEPETEEVDEPEPEPVEEETEDAESAPEPVQPEPSATRALMPPPPPPPKGGVKKPLSGLPRKPLPLVRPGSTSVKRPLAPLDNNTVDMFSPQLAQPLQSIVQLAEMISSDENAVPQLKKYAIAIQAKSNRLMSQLEDMSMLASAQKGLLEVSDKPFNLSQMISGLVDLATNVMPDQKQKILYNGEEQDLLVVSDEGHFEKILSNLINVMLHATSEKDVSLSLKSEQPEENKESEKTISYEGKDLQISSNHRIHIRADFPIEPGSAHLFDITVNRGQDNAIIHNVQNNGALKNHISSLRLVKELSRVIGGKVGFSSEGEEQGVIEISLELPCAQIGSYPA